MNQTKSFQNLPSRHSTHSTIRAITFLLIITLALVQSNEPNHDKKSAKDKAPTKVISLAESINRSQKSLKDPERAKSSREQWERALKEIKELALDFPKSTQRQRPEKKKIGEYTEWKLLLEEPSEVEVDSDSKEGPKVKTTTQVKPQTSRFDGFASWERILQDWADDVQEYLDKVEAQNSDYPMSTYGIPITKKDQDVSNEPKPSGTKLEGKIVDKSATPKAAEKKTEKTRINLPVPAPAKDGEEVLPHTDISDKSKNIWIVTTAALPWMTGTAVNPLLRAAYMTNDRMEAGGSVTLMLPWLERKQDRDSVYGTSRSFDTPDEQEAFIRNWLIEKAKVPDSSERLKIKWYTAWQNKAENSLYSMGDITAEIPSEDVDIMILEEPEHLNWYRAPGEAWTGKFKHVVGIVHTNYFVYAQDQPAAFIRAPGMRLLCSWMCRAHCHRLIKLSGTLGRFAPEKELVENVHGVRASFLDTGAEVRNRLQAGVGAQNDPIFGSEADPTVYFIGKMLWSKGLGSLMELLKYTEESAGIKVHVDMYGGGPDKHAAEERAKSLGVDMDFLGPVDHGELGSTHKIFVNPSTSEVLTTTTAEALAMGKFVVLPSHPSNDFFAQFSNCLTYANKEEFVGNLYYALTHSPKPLSDSEAFTLSWEAATKRLEAAGSIPKKEAEMRDEALRANEAGIEIALPPLIENDEDREKIVDRLRSSRNRYRQFRSRLSEEIMQSNVLPPKLKEQLTAELGKRLDLDIDKILESPKLQLQLSPAELDKRLLELYEGVAEGPSGDLLRVIGGGQDVAFQNLYIKRRARRERQKSFSHSMGESFGSFETDEFDGNQRSASQRVRRALRRNMLKNSSRTDEDDTKRQQGPDEQNSKLNMSCGTRFGFAPSRMVSTAKRNHFCPPRRSSTFKFTLLI